MKYHGNRVRAAGCVAAMMMWSGSVRAQMIELPVIPLAEGNGVEYRHEEGEKKWYTKGLRKSYDGALDVLEYARRGGGIVVDVEKGGDEIGEISAELTIPEQPARLDLVPGTKAIIKVSGRGKQQVRIPFSSFNFLQAQPAFLKFIQTVRVTGSSGIKVSGVRFVEGFGVGVSAGIRGKSVASGETAEYVVQVSNTTGEKRTVSLGFEKYGWEAHEAEVTPNQVVLEPGGKSEVKVLVKLSGRVTPGGREKTVMTATADDDATRIGRITLWTMAALPHPYILHNADGWADVKAKAENYVWAQKGAQDIIKIADAWVVPEVAKTGENQTGVDNMGPYLFATQIETQLMNSGFAYQLTGDKKYAEKIRTFMLRLSDPEAGYPKTLRGCNQSLVQEGHWFQHIAKAYDMALPSGIFTADDKKQIERTMRLFIETIQFESDVGAINNWNVSEVIGALYCGMVLQDWAVVERFYSGPSGVLDQMSKGIMDDGWWYECAISYNVWVSSQFTQVGLAMQPFGVDLLHAKVPVSFTPNFSILPWGLSRQYGQSFEKWGPIRNNYVDIKRMWDALPKFADYRGVMFGVNDATEAQLGGTRREISGSPYELAYYVYRDPAYASLIRRGNKTGETARDLLFGVPELPDEVTGNESFKKSAYADNVGVAMLRSQTPNREAREQIQAVLHYGTHGGYHGHFDRTSLLNLSRYGRSFFNPEAVWYSYAPFMYKFFVQNSTSKNMVVVDRKMQEPVESDRILWYTGNLMQATAVETVARWSTPPYGGMVYPEQGYKSLQEKSWGEGRYLPKPQNEPEYGSVTQFTEPIQQRRLMVVTDDYVLIADYLRGEKQHTFESLYQMKGFLGVAGEGKKLVRHDGQWDDNPILDAQFMTDASWYEMKAPTLASFEMKWGPGADNAGTRAPTSEDGIFRIDVYHLWPSQQEQMLATVPEEHGNEKRLFYSVRGDGKILAEGKFGSWILGKGDLDMNVEGIETLELETRTELAKRPTIFWAGGVVTTKEGKEIPLSSLSTQTENITPAKEPGKDYFGGPIKIVGVPYSEAVAGEPKDNKKPAVVKVNLKGLGAVRLKVVVGGDYPLGDESQRRKTYASKISGSEARFLTLIEPSEGKGTMVKSAKAIDSDRVQVELLDGRMQVIELNGFARKERQISVRIVESKDGKVIRTEEISN